MKKGFTLVEVMMTVAIVLILATIALTGYRQVIENARQSVCATNLLVLEAAIENHFQTTGIAPATLGEIKLEYLRDAYAEVMKDTDWWTKFSYFLTRLNTPKQAYAQIDELKDLVDPEIMRAYGIPVQVFQCPSDNTPEGISYGININLKHYHTWKDVPSDLIIIGDCDSYTFSSDAALTKRHMKNFGLKKIAQGARKRGKIKKKIIKLVPWLPDDDDDDDDNDD